MDFNWNKHSSIKGNTFDADIWLCNAHDVIGHINYFFSLLSGDEKKRALRYKFEKHKNRFIISHAFTRKILSKYLAQNVTHNLRWQANKIIIKTSQFGKPYIENSTIHFNLSHTKNISLLAVSKENEVGVDIESINRTTDWKAITKRFFTVQEQKYFFNLEENIQRESFYELWTRKEAYMKVLGTGMSLPPDGFTLSVPPSPGNLIEHHFKKYKSEHKIIFKKLDLPKNLNNFRATLAIINKDNQS